MSWNNFFVYFTICIFSIAITAAEGKFFYVIEKNDNVSTILYKAKLFPLYGKNGSIAKVAQLNADHIQDIDKVYPGDKLYIPDPMVQKSVTIGAIRVEDSNRIFFVKHQDHVQIYHKRKVAENNSTFPTQSASIQSETNQVQPEKTETPVKELVKAEDLKVVKNQQEKIEVVLEEKNKTEDFPIRYSINLLTDYSMIFGKDKLYSTTAKLLSKLNYGFIIDWEKHWNQSLLVKLFVARKSVSIEPDSGSTHLYNSKKDLIYFGAGIEQNYSEQFAAGVDASYADTLFYRGYLLDSSGLELIALPLLHLHPTLNYTLFERRPFRVTAEAGFSYFGSATYDNFTVSPGYGYDLGIKLTQKFKNLNELSCKAYYQNRNQQTSLIDLNEKSLGVSCGYQWSF